MTNELIFINDNGNIETNPEVAKTKPLLIELRNKIIEYGIDIDSLTSDEANDLLKCILIASR